MAGRAKGTAMAKVATKTKPKEEEEEEVVVVENILAALHQSPLLADSNRLKRKL